MKIGDFVIGQDEELVYTGVLLDRGHVLVDTIMEIINNGDLHTGAGLIPYAKIRWAVKTIPYGGLPRPEVQHLANLYFARNVSWINYPVSSALDRVCNKGVVCYYFGEGK